MLSYMKLIQKLKLLLHIKKSTELYFLAVCQGDSYALFSHFYFAQYVVHS